MRRRISGARSSIGNSRTLPLAPLVEPIRLALRPVEIVTIHWEASVRMAMTPRFAAGDGARAGAGLVGGLSIGHAPSSTADILAGGRGAACAETAARAAKPVNVATMMRMSASITPPPGGSVHHDH
jgi:hypothetical protein